MLIDDFCTNLVDTSVCMLVCVGLCLRHGRLVFMSTVVLSACVCGCLHFTLRLIVYIVLGRHMYARCVYEGVYA